MKDTAPTTDFGTPVARISVYDEVAGAPLGAVLSGSAPVKGTAVAEFLCARIAAPAAG